MRFITRGCAVLLLPVLSVLFLHVACSQEMSGQTVTLSPSYESSKTAEDISISPDPGTRASVIKYKARRADGTSSAASVSDWTEASSSADSFQISNVSAGRWIFTVGAFTTAGLQMYEGSAEVMVQSGRNVSATVVMMHCRESARGSLLIDVSSYARRGVASNTLSVKYRRAGDSAWTEVEVLPGTLTENYSIIPWNKEITGLSGGRYEVCLNCMRDGKAYGGKTFTVDVFAGRRSSVTGFLSGGETEKHETLKISLHDLIDIAETFDVRLPIVGFVDTLTGQDFTEEILAKGGEHTLYNCNASGISGYMSFDSLGIRPVYMQNYTDEQKRAVKLLLVTRNCLISAGTNTGWLANTYNKVPAVKTVYVNRNLDVMALYFASNVDRLILGRDPAFTKISYRSLSVMNSVPELYIPSNIKEIEEDAVAIHSPNLVVWCAQPAGTFEDYCLAVRGFKNISWNTEKPIREL